ETMKSALPRLDCVFLEAGTDEQGAIDRIANLQKPGCPPLDDDFSKILQLEDKLRAEGVITTSRNVAPKTFGPMILRAKSLGI
ncbi:hypothetical protein, partial [Klebsiella pneumoniae]|uniref:hypothetical protein n=1 Tax=Klebsiella pneumoniae TaxID=573 RepID=UPI003B97F584